jgi:cyclopropane-fatty-acyl-phospholipid synthase
MTVQVLPKDRSLSKFVANLPALDKWCRSVLVNKFTDLKNGYLIISDRSAKTHAEYTFGESNAALQCKIIVYRSSFYSRTLLGGSIGNGESYVDGDWDTDDLTNLVRIFVINRDLLQSIDGGIGSLLQPIQRVFHGLRGNTINGSLANIRSHYDIGNDFFKLFLDETMMYSSGVYQNKDSTLHEASELKIMTLCQKLDLKPEEHLIEIGTGWGSLAIYAAKTFGCRVTTTTISIEQFTYATEKVKHAGLQDRITVLFDDYRKLTGVYDKLISVEMIEAVGLDNLDVFFAKCSSLIKPNGIMVLQAITIRDQYYKNARKSVDFIQRHIFPGTGIPSVNAIMNSITNKTDMVLIDQKDFAEDYAHTLKDWSVRLGKNKAEITKLGYPDFLYRLWQYYFSYCEGGFRERAIGLSQMTLTKTNYRNRSLL